MMKTMHRLIPVLLAGALAWGPSTAADPPALEKTVVAAATGAVGAAGAASEAVVFVGEAQISGKVIYDTVLGAPPILEIIVDLSKVTGRGTRSGKPYVVSSQAILHRPLLAFDQVEVSFPFAAGGSPLQARSATASFGIYYSAAKGMTTTPVRISPHAPI